MSEISGGENIEEETIKKIFWPDMNPELAREFIGTPYKKVFDYNKEISKGIFPLIFLNIIMGIITVIMKTRAKIYKRKYPEEFI